MVARHHNGIQRPSKMMTIMVDVSVMFLSPSGSIYLNRICDSNIRLYTGMDDDVAVRDRSVIFGSEPCFVLVCHESGGVDDDGKMM